MLFSKSVFNQQKKKVIGTKSLHIGLCNEFLKKENSSIIMEMPFFSKAVSIF